MQWVFFYCYIIIINAINYEDKLTHKLEGITRTRMHARAQFIRISDKLLVAKDINLHTLTLSLKLFLCAFFLKSTIKCLPVLNCFDLVLGSTLAFW